MRKVRLTLVGIAFSVCVVLVYQALVPIGEISNLVLGTALVLGFALAWIVEGILYLIRGKTPDAKT